MQAPTHPGSYAVLADDHERLSQVTSDTDILFIPGCLDGPVQYTAFDLDTRDRQGPVLRAVGIFTQVMMDTGDLTGPATHTSVGRTNTLLNMPHPK